MNLMMLLEMASSSFGERIAVKSGARELSYRSLFQAAGRAASIIADAGVERVAMLDVNSLAVPIALFASAQSGLPFAPLNYRLTAAEVERLSGQIAPALLITDAERAPTLEKIDGIQVLLRDDFLDRVLGRVGRLGRVGEVEDAARGAASGASDWPMDPDGIAILLFTSGGLPAVLP